MLRELRTHQRAARTAEDASLPIIGRTLQHKNVSTTAIYARLNLDPVRESMQKAATAMFAAGGLMPTAKVGQIREGKRNSKAA